MNLVPGHYEEEVSGCGLVRIDWGTIQIIFKASQRLSWSQLTKEVRRCRLNISSLAKLELRGMTLNLTL